MRFFFNHLVHFGKSPFTIFEQRLFSKICLIVDENMAEVISSQIDEINFVQRICDDEEIDFYKIEKFQINLSRKKLSHLEDGVIFSGDVKFSDNNKVKVKLNQVKRIIFSLEFSDSVREYRHSDNFELASNINFKL